MLEVFFAYKAIAIKPKFFGFKLFQQLPATKSLLTLINF